MKIQSVCNTGVPENQQVTGTEDIVVEELVLRLPAAGPGRAYASAVLTVLPGSPGQGQELRGEKLIGKIEAAGGDEDKTEPRQIGPYGFRTSDPKAQNSFVLDGDFPVRDGVDYTVRVLVSVSDTGSDSYLLRGQGSCRLTLIFAPED